MRTILLYYIIGLFLFCGMGFSQESPEVEVRSVEVIIKVKPDVIIMPEGTYKAPLGEIEIKSDELKKANKKFNLLSVEKMFARKKPEEKVAKEFPDREARRPEAAEEADLENIFILKFPEHIKPSEIVAEYKKIEDVIYAEENKIATIF